MAAAPGTADTVIEEILLTQGHRFSFHQAMRLLLMLTEHGGAGGEAPRVRVRPRLDLAFPPAEVAGIEKTRDGYQVEATFLGLYGTSSPLPTFYSEDLLEEAAGDASAARDLLDLVHQHVYDLYADCATKYCLNSHLAQPQPHQTYLGSLFGLIGLDHIPLCQDFPEPRVLLRHAGILAQHPRSALGLQAFLADALQIPVQIIQGLNRRVSLAPEQRLQLGAANTTLGEDAVIGSLVPDGNGMFRIRLGPLDRETFSGLLPGTPRRRLLDLLVEVYLCAPLTWDVELVAAAGEAPAVALGHAGRLGWDSCLAPDPTAEVSTVFPRAESDGSSCAEGYSVSAAG